MRLGSAGKFRDWQLNGGEMIVVYFRSYNRWSGPGIIRLRWRHDIVATLSHATAL